RSDLLRTAEERAAVVLDAAVLQAQSAAPDARTHGTAVVGSPVPVLLGAAADAGLLVVGGRAVGATRPMLGPVTSQIATYAPGLLANCWNLSSAEVFRAAEATGLADDRAELGPTQSGLHTPARA
ncbi:hypothetical protein M1L60_45920, partial [Actinoplanes sp. TRM 88003]|nr:hypothetical protein [Actinoplanes aksuensis]